MSYFTNNSSSNPLAFPSYNQLNIQQRNINGLNSITGNSVAQLQHLYHRQHLPHLHASGAPSANASSAATNPTLPTKDKSSSDDDEKGTKRERKNRPGQKFGAKKKSWVWTWFVQDSSDPNVAVCDYCGKIITRMPSDKGLPKKLSEHLKTHKLLKDSINTARPIPIDGNGITYSPGGLQMPYANAYTSPSAANAVVAPNISMNLQVMAQAAHNQTHNQSHANHNLSGSGHQNHQNLEEDLEPKPKKFRRAGAMTNLPPDRMIHPQLQNQSASSPQFGRRYISPNFDNTPYSGSKFHRHLLKFLADNKLLIRLLKLHLFQQLIYDLRPDLITDLLELTGLYLSFIEVSRADSDPDRQGEATLAEANVVNTLAQELIKK